MPSNRVQRIKSRRPSASFGSRTDVGCVRDHNEDSLIVQPPLFAVADGMGGHAAGEVASEIACTTLAERAPRTPDAEALGRAVEDANRAVILAADEARGRAGMGTTMTAAVLQRDRLVIAQVGDSRAYLLHQGKLQQLTRDHSLMADLIEAGRLTPEEARNHPNRSVITRALGSDPRMTPDLYEITVETGDRLLLCSDGLSTMIEDDGIEAILARTRDPQRCASVLVNEAIAAGGHDNITVVVVDIAGQIEKNTRRYKRRSRLFMAFIVVLLAAIVGAAGFGLNAYVNTVAYLIDEGGTVSVYHGVPDELFGRSLSWLDRTTDVQTSELQPGVATRLQSGIRVDSIDEANRLIEEYQAYIQQKNGETQAHEASSNGDASSSNGSGNSGESASANAASEGSAASDGADASTTEASGGDAA